MHLLIVIEVTLNSQFGHSVLSLIDLQRVVIIIAMFYGSPSAPGFDYSCTSKSLNLADDTVYGPITMDGGLPYFGQKYYQLYVSCGFLDTLLKLHEV